jgi:hypothetical protein
MLRNALCSSPFFAPFLLQVFFPPTFLFAFIHQEAHLEWGIVENINQREQPPQASVSADPNNANFGAKWANSRRA